MFPGPLPDEMPGVLRVHADGAAPVTVRCMEGARVRFFQAALTVDKGITVIARRCRHEANAEDAPVRGVAETTHVKVLGISGLPKLPFHNYVGKRVLRVRGRHVEGNFHKVVGLNGLGGLRKSDI